MATIFHVFPSEIFIKGIFPSLPVGSIYCVGRVSKAANELVQAAAKESQDDMTLEGKITPIVLDGTVAAFLRQRIKMQILTTRQDLLNNLKIVRDAVRDTNSFAKTHELEFMLTPEPEIMELYNHARTSADAKAAMLPIVLFDFNTKQIPAKGEDGLAGLLQNAANETNLELVQMILKHPNAPDISGEDEELTATLGIRSALGVIIDKTDSVETVLQFLSHPYMEKRCGIPLNYAVFADKLTMVEAILSHRYAANIPADGAFSLGSALVAAVSREEEDPEMARAIFSYPNAVKISITGERGLAYAVTMAVENRNLALVKEILSQPNAAKIPVDGTLGLSEILSMAIRKFNLSSRRSFRDEYKGIMQEILSHPNAVNIPTKVLDEARELLKQ
jgi:hypothetical protein